VTSGVRVRRAYANVGRLQLHYRHAGAAGLPTLVLLHGGPGFDHTHFKPWFTELREDAQLVFLDHRGQGRSDRSDPSHWNLATWADDVADFCAALSIRRPARSGCV